MTYEPKVYCLNLVAKWAPIEAPNTSTEKYFTEYHCKITNKLCVGDKAGFWVWSDNKLDPEIIKRCPSRTIDALVTEAQK